MALSDKQKHRVVFYLGWSGLTLVDGSTQFNSVVNDRLGVPAKPLNADIEKIVREILDKLEEIDAQLKQARCRLSAKQVDGIKLNEREIEMLKKERWRCIRELSDHLDIPVTKSSSNMMSIVV